MNITTVTMRGKRMPGVWVDVPVLVNTLENILTSDNVTGQLAILIANLRKQIGE